MTNSEEFFIFPKAVTPSQKLRITDFIFVSSANFLPIKYPRVTNAATETTVIAIFVTDEYNCPSFVPPPAVIKKV